MKFTSTLLAAATLLAPVYSHAIHHHHARSVAAGLDVVLTSVGNTEVKVSVTNTANHEISVLNMNTFFDDSPIQKVNVHKAGSDEELTFNGIVPRYDLEHLTQADFTLIAVGATVDATFDIAETLDLSEGGDYVISAHGVLPVANAAFDAVSSIIPYKSNTITVHVDGAVAAEVDSVHRRFERNARRSTLTSCTPERQAVVTSALARAAKIAGDAGHAALSGDAATFERYFHSKDASVRKSVSDRFLAVAAEASKTSGGKIQYSCGDAVDSCKHGVIAYAMSGRNLIVNCATYYIIANTTTSCSGKDQALASIHEYTHMASVYAPPTTDIAYGYEASIALTSAQALRNADTFLYYANAVRYDCKPADVAPPPAWWISVVNTGKLPEEIEEEKAAAAAKAAAQ